MHQVLVNFGLCYLVCCQYFVDESGDGFDGEIDQAWAVHVQAALPAFSVPWLDGVFGQPLSAIGNQKHVTTASITSELETAQSLVLRAVYQCGGCPVTKNGPQAPVVFIDVLAVSFGGQKQDVLGNAGLHETVGNC